MEVSSQGLEPADEADERIKGLWLRKNYEPLFYGMLTKNQQIRQTVTDYRRAHRLHLASKTVSTKYPIL